MNNFKKIQCGDSFINISGDRRLVLGFSENNCRLPDLSAHFRHRRCIELKQVHSADIYVSGAVQPGSQGDGLILEETNILALIKTADCVPLFFWDKEYTAAGILHVGWQGLFKGIEKRLPDMLKKKSLPLERLRFFLGPAIERDCYEVGRDLFDKFAAKSYRDDIFFKKGDKYTMDIKKGIILSLKEAGISPAQVGDCGLCTFCLPGRFPSYRRDNKTGDRIYNFICLKE